MSDYNQDSDDGFYFDNADEPVFPTPDEAKPKDKDKAPPTWRQKANRSADASLLSKQKLEKLYDRVQPYLSNEQRRYTKAVLNGTANVDTTKELELLVRQCSLLFSEASVVFMNEKRVSRDLASFADSYRMAVKDLAELRRIERADQEKTEEVGTMSAADRERQKAKVDALLGL